MSDDGLGRIEGEEKIKSLLNELQKDGSKFYNIDKIKTDELKEKEWFKRLWEFLSSQYHCIPILDKLKPVELYVLMKTAFAVLDIDERNIDVEEIDVIDEL